MQNVAPDSAWWRSEESRLDLFSISPFGLPSDWVCATICAQGARSQYGAGGLCSHRTPSLALGKAKTEEFTASSRAKSRLSRRAGHPLCRQMKGVGRIYQQTFIDTYAKVVFARLYERKTLITAAEIVNDQVLPFFGERGILLGANGSRQAAIAATPSNTTIGCISPSRTSITPGPRPRARRRLESTSASIEPRSMSPRPENCRTIDELKSDLDCWQKQYNRTRSHQGLWCHWKNADAARRRVNCQVKCILLQAQQAALSGWALCTHLRERGRTCC